MKKFNKKRLIFDSRNRFNRRFKSLVGMELGCFHIREINREIVEGLIHSKVYSYGTIEIYRIKKFSIEFFAVFHTISKSCFTFWSLNMEHRFERLPEYERYLEKYVIEENDNLEDYRIFNVQKWLFKDKEKVSEKLFYRDKEFSRVKGSRLIRLPNNKVVPEPKSKTQWKRLSLYMESNICCLCGEEIKNIDDSNLDHNIPKSKGGSDDLSNLQLTHKFCNSAKGNCDPRIIDKEKMRKLYLQSAGVSVVNEHKETIPKETISFKDRLLNFGKSLENHRIFYRVSGPYYIFLTIIFLQLRKLDSGVVNKL